MYNGANFNFLKFNDDEDYGMRRNAFWTGVCGLLLFVGIAAESRAVFQYSIVNAGGPPGGTFVLPRSASTPVSIFLSSTDANDRIAALSLRITIGDGVLNAVAEPPIVGVTPQGLFAPISGYAAGGGQPAFFDASNSQMIYDLSATPANQIGFLGSQLVATVNLNTLGFPISQQGPFNFLLTTTNAGTSGVGSPAGPAYAGTGLVGGTFTLAAVPEPSSMVLLGLVGVGAVAARRFRKKSKV